MKHGHFQADSFCDEKDKYPEMSEAKWHTVHNYTGFLSCSGSKPTVNFS